VIGVRRLVTIMNELSSCCSERIQPSTGVPSDDVLLRGLRLHDHEALRGRHQDVLQHLVVHPTHEEHVPSQELSERSGKACHFIHRQKVSLYAIVVNA
jgi:hypothetical protein